MLTILTDSFPSDAVTPLVLAAAAERKKCVLLVPEQQTLLTEAAYAALLPPDAPLYFEVSNFSRLANSAFRLLGGVCHRRADRAAELLLMWKTLYALAPMLSSGCKPSVGKVKELLAAREELAASGIGEDELRRAAEGLKGEEKLKEKLSNLSLILKIYEGEKRERFGPADNDLSALYALLTQNDLFSDTTFFVESFSSFTLPELAVLGELMRKSDVTVSLTLPGDAAAHLCYEETAETERVLLRLAEKIGCETRTAAAKERPMPADLLHARDELFRADRRLSLPKERDGSLVLMRAKNPVTAADEVAAVIARGIREGKRYRDYAIVTANSRAYEGVLDVALEKAGIPCFLSVETDITRFAAVRALTCALTTVTRGFRREDLLSYLKCGQNDLSPDERDLFELYCEFWHLRGKSFSSDEPFTLPPHGLSPTLSEADEQELRHLNESRRRLLSPLWGLKKEMAEASSVSELCTAVYHYLREVKMEERARADAALAQASGRRDEAEALLRLSAAIYALLDLIHEAMGEDKPSPDLFAELFSLLLSATSLGSLPTTTDAVTVGNVDTLRLRHVSTVFLFGVNDGELPTVPSFHGAFEESERRALLSVGLTVGNDPMIDASRASFRFLRALCSPSERALLLSFETGMGGETKRPSAPFSRLEGLFGDASAPTEQIFSKRAAVDKLHRLEGTPEGEALSALLREDESFRRYADMGKERVCDEDCTISRELAGEVFPSRLQTSQSRLEKYKNCPFSYYCAYVLKLPEKQAADLGASDIGTLVHALLETVFDRIEKNGLTIRTVKREDLARYTEQVAADYLRASFPDALLASPRLHHLFLRLRRAATLLIEDLYDEFADSDFVPTFFELPIGKDGGPEVLSFKDEAGEVRISGTIDRVDTYRDEKGDVYIRVIDYKTGSKAFAVDNIKKGRNLQMFLYLCTLWKTKNEDFLARVGLKDKCGEIFPAGMLYTKAAVSAAKLDTFLSDSEAAAVMRKDMSRSGLLLQDERILRAMSHSLSKHFIPVTVEKSGSIKWNDSCATLERMGELLGEMEEAVLGIVSEMRSGRAAAVPADKKEAGIEPCKSCAYKPFCRKETE